jgi:hypothetical protein
MCLVITGDLPCNVWLAEGKYSTIALTVKDVASNSVPRLCWPIQSAEERQILARSRMACKTHWIGSEVHTRYHFGSTVTPCINMSAWGHGYHLGTNIHWKHASPLRWMPSVALDGYIDRREGQVISDKPNLLVVSHMFLFLLNLDWWSSIDSFRSSKYPKNKRWKSANNG